MTTENKYEIGYLAAKVEVIETKVNEIHHDVKSLLSTRNRQYGAAAVVSAIISAIIAFLAR